MRAAGDSYVDLVQTSDDQMTEALGPGEASQYALLLGIDALRHAVLATAAADDRVEEEDAGVWARVELFGHTVAHGLVREVVRYGHRWLEVSWPEIVEPLLQVDAMVDADDRVPRVFPAGAKLYHPNAVYALQATTEDAAMTAIHHRFGIRTAEELATGRYTDDNF